jgi:hypothetical protein
MPNYTEFHFTITLGNDAMQTTEEVVDALKWCAKRITGGKDYGDILDINGNTVGYFEFTPA